MALQIGILILGVAAALAYMQDIPTGDFFAGVMAGAGAIGTVMAGFEAADAAESANRIAQQANAERVQVLLGMNYGAINAANILIVNDGVNPVFVDQVKLTALMPNGTRIGIEVVCEPTRMEGFTNLSRLVERATIDAQLNFYGCSNTMPLQAIVTTATTRQFFSNIYTPRA